MTELAFNIAGWVFTVGLAIYGTAIFWLYTWMRTLEHAEGDDDGEE